MSRPLSPRRRNHARRARIGRGLRRAPRGSQGGTACAPSAGGGEAGAARAPRARIRPRPREADRMGGAWHRCTRSQRSFVQPVSIEPGVFGERRRGPRSTVSGTACAIARRTSMRGRRSGGRPRPRRPTAARRRDRVQPRSLPARAKRLRRAAASKRRGRSSGGGESTDSGAGNRRSGIRRLNSSHLHKYNFSIRLSGRCPGSAAFSSCFPHVVLSYVYRGGIFEQKVNVVREKINLCIPLKHPYLQRLEMRI